MKILLSITLIASLMTGTAYAAGSPLERLSNPHPMAGKDQPASAPDPTMEKQMNSDETDSDDVPDTATTAEPDSTDKAQ